MDPLTTLLAMEEIKQLKAGYVQILDAKDWTALAAPFTSDAIIVYNRHARDLIGRLLLSRHRSAIAATVRARSPVSRHFASAANGMLRAARNGRPRQVDLPGMRHR